jgi:preprotein translocase subunit YajC
MFIGVDEEFIVNRIFLDVLTSVFFFLQSKK